MVNTKLLEALKNSRMNDNPWEHFTFEGALTDEQIDEIRNASIPRDGVLHDGTRSGYKEGVEKQNHKLREYITKDNYHRYPELTKFINEMRGKEVREAIAQMVKNENNFAGSFVRLEVLNDVEGFWLKPHCDIPEKLISSLIYVNKFWNNLGYIFAGPNKWHGMDEGKNIKVERRGIQLNYVTFQTDWPVHED